MRKLITLLLMLSFYYACESIEIYRQGNKAKRTTQLATNTDSERPEYKVVVIKHPYLNFPLSDPASVVIYEGFKPLNDKSIFMIRGSKHE